VTRTDTSGWPCPLARTADLIGEGWTLLIMREAFYGVRRFEEFQRVLGLGRNILTLRLNTLVDEGLLTKVQYQERPPRHEYRLTDKGRDVYPILAAMATFGDKWLLGDTDPLVIFHHVTCDHDMHAVVTCSECAQPLDVRSVRARPGPGYPTDLAVPGHA
jgi:DNA-binding HxlR family transcriptional regulator